MCVCGVQVVRLNYVYRQYLMLHCLQETSSYHHTNYDKIIINYRCYYTNMENNNNMVQKDSCYVYTMHTSEMRSSEVNWMAKIYYNYTNSSFCLEGILLILKLLEWVL